MSDSSQGDGWWIASDGKWYAPERHPDYQAPPTPPEVAATETIVIPPADAPIIQPAVAASPTFTPPGAATEPYLPDQSSDPDFDLSTPDEPASSKRGLLLGLGAVVLLVGLGFLAFRLLGGSSSATGASSPEAAIDQLIASVNEKDLVGFVAAWDPDEVDAWFGSFTPAFDAFSEVTDGSLTENDLTRGYASALDSFNFTLTGPNGDDVNYEVEQLDDEGRIVRVRVDGLDFTIDAPNAGQTALIAATGDDANAFDLSQVDGAEIQLRDQGDGLAARLLRPDFAPEDEFAPGAHLDLVTVQKGGEWYVSMGYSLLNQVDEQDGFPGFAEPDFGRAFRLVEGGDGGADSPQALARELLFALEGLDYDNAIRLSDPLGTPYLHDYQPLIDDEVDEQERLNAVRELALSFDDVEFGVSEWEGRTLVTLPNLAGRAGDATFDIDTTRWCATIDDGFDSQSGCLVDLIAEGLAQIDNFDDPAGFLPDEAGIVVVERNGRWYFDALGTYGYYIDQASDALVNVYGALDVEEARNELDQFATFAIFEAPIAREGSPATHVGDGSGNAGVALDLSGYETIDDRFGSRHIAVARVLSDADGSFVTYGNVQLTGEDWIVVHQGTDDNDGELPAIAARTDGELDVELVPVVVTEIGADGFTGQIGGEGRPQVFTFSPELKEDAFKISGADAQSVFYWESSGPVYPERFTSSSAVNDSFIIVTGEPGATFDIAIALFDAPAPEQEPEPVPEPPAFDGLGDGIADDFASVVGARGYEYISEQAGGYFDGCGPDDPDVTSYLFEGPTSFDPVIITPYPSIARAEAAYAALVAMTSPCDAFEDLVIESVDIIDETSVRIGWSGAESTEPTYEQYRLAGITIVVAVGSDLTSLDEQLEVLSEW